MRVIPGSLSKIMSENGNGKESERHCYVERVGSIAMFSVLFACIA